MNLGSSAHSNPVRKQVVTPVKDDGECIIPTHILSRRLSIQESRQNVQDAEVIYPLPPSLGIGAMHILSDWNTDLNRDIHSTVSPTYGLSRPVPDTYLEVRSPSLSIQTTTRATHDDVILVGDQAETIDPSKSDVVRPSEANKRPSILNLYVQSNLPNVSESIDQERKLPGENYKSRRFQGNHGV